VKVLAFIKKFDGFCRFSALFLVSLVHPTLLTSNPQRFMRHISRVQIIVKRGSSCRSLLVDLFLAVQIEQKMVGCCVLAVFVDDNSALCDPYEFIGSFVASEGLVYIA